MLVFCGRVRFLEKAPRSRKIVGGPAGVLALAAGVTGSFIGYLYFRKSSRTRGGSGDYGGQASSSGDSGGPSSADVGGEPSLSGGGDGGGLPPSSRGGDGDGPSSSSGGGDGDGDGDGGAVYPPLSSLMNLSGLEPDACADVIARAAFCAVWLGGLGFVAWRARRRGGFELAREDDDDDDDDGGDDDETEEDGGDGGDDGDGGDGGDIEDAAAAGGGGDGGVAALGRSEIGRALLELGLAALGPAFAAQNLLVDDLEAVRALSDGDLDRLGVSMGDRRRIRLAVAA